MLAQCVVWFTVDIFIRKQRATHDAMLQNTVRGCSGIEYYSMMGLSFFKKYEEIVQWCRSIKAEVWVLLCSTCVLVVVHARCCVPIHILARCVRWCTYYVCIAVALSNSVLHIN